MLAANHCIRSHRTVPAANVRCLGCTTERANRQAFRSGPCRSSIGKDAVEGFFDLAKLVTSGGQQQSSAFDELASRLGYDVYIDVNGWHLYLRDVSIAPNVKLHRALAQQLGMQMSAKGFDDRDIEDFIKKVPIKLGGGKLQVSLHDVMPTACLRDFVKICEDYNRDVL